LYAAKRRQIVVQLAACVEFPNLNHQAAVLVPIHSVSCVVFQWNHTQGGLGQCTTYTAPNLMRFGPLLSGQDVAQVS
jgi:hypothetical protein